jgi:hypothetical protein
MVVPPSLTTATAGQFHMLRVAQYVDRNEMADVGRREPLW